MNPDLAKYLSTQLSTTIKIWLQVLAQTPKAGNYIVMYDHLIQANNVTDVKFKRLFKPKIAQKLGLLQILESNADGIVLKIFNKTAAVPVKPIKTVKSKIIKPLQNQSVVIIQQAIELPNPQNNLQLATINPTVDVNGLNIGPVPPNFTLKGKLHHCIIADYVQFYKQDIQRKAALVGNYIENPLAPKLTGLDGKAFNELACYFAKNGFFTEQNIRLAFQKIYSNWQDLPYNLQNYNSPAQINRNIGQIYNAMVQISKTNNPKNQTKKDAQLTEKINAAQARDYSHMVKTKPEGNL